MIRKKIKHCFTLLELLVSMGVFAILMLALMQFFSSAQTIWTTSNAKTDMYENAKIAMNLIAADLMNLYYEHGGDNPKTFFLAGVPSTSDPPSGKLENETSEFTVIGFSTLRPEAATALSDTSKKGITRITEVIYLYDPETNRLYIKNLVDRDVDAAPSGTTWCTENNNTTNKAEDTLLFKAIKETAHWSEMISDVVECKFTLLNNKMQPLKISENSKEWTFQPKNLTMDVDRKGRIPYAVSISLVMLDQESIAKMKAITGKEKFKDILTDNIKGDTEPSDEKEKVLWQLYHTGKQDFSRVVTIDRGQYN